MSQTGQVVREFLTVTNNLGKGCKQNSFYQSDSIATRRHVNVVKHGEVITEFNLVTIKFNTAVS